MGLDMYLHARRVLADYDFQPDEKQISKEIYKLLSVEDVVEHNNSISVDIPVAYWRKANAIHRWMVENVQGGEDDCGEYWVSRDAAAKLLEVCINVRKDPSKAKELLPPQEGFFFGSAEVDDWYLRQIGYTVDRLSLIIDNPDLKDFDFYYQSSW